MTEKSFGRQFLIIFIIAFIIYLSNQMVATTVPTFADSMGAASQMVGMITGAFGIMALIPRPISGQMVDRQNNKVMLLSCIIILLLSNILLVTAKSPAYLLISRGVYGFGWGFGSTLCLTTACKSLRGDNLAGGIAIYTLGQTLAMVLGPSLAVEILYQFSYRALYCVTSGLLVLAFCLSLAMKPQKPPEKMTKYSLAVKDMFAYEAAVPAFLMLCNSMLTAAVTAFTVLYAKTLGLPSAGWFFTLQAVVVLLCRPFISKLKTGKRIIRLVIICEFLIIAGAVSLFFAHGKGAIIAAAILLGVGSAGSQPAIMNLCVIAVSPDKTGVATNTNYAGADVGSFIGPNLAGFIAASLGYKYIYLLMIVPVVFGLSIFWTHYFKKKI